MQVKVEPRTTGREPRREQRSESPRPYENTRPRGNGEPDRRDLERSIERFEMLLGR